MYKRIIPKFNRPTLTALAEVITVNNVKDLPPNYLGKVVRLMEKQIASMPPHFRLLISVSLIWVELASIFSRRPLPLSKRSLESRLDYLKEMDERPENLNADILRVVRSMCIMMYFNLPAIWSYIGYSPNEQLERAIKRRNREITVSQKQFEEQRDQFMKEQRNDISRL